MPADASVWGLLVAVAAAATLAERFTAWGAALSAPLVAITLGYGLATVGALPSTAACGAYTLVWGCVMPVASALLVLESRDMSR